MLGKTLISRLALIGSLAAALAVTAAVARPRAAHAEPVVSAAVVGGVDQDFTGIARLIAGGLWDFGRFAPDFHISLEGFIRLNSDAGVSARSITLGDLGARYAFLNDRFVGPFVTAGASFGIFTGKPHDRKISDAPEVCASAPGSPADCTFRINRNAAFRGGLGWGFASGPKTTVAVRLDVTYWMFSLNDFEDQPDSAPVPRDVPRPQDSIAVLVGLEFMRWR